MKTIFFTLILFVSLFANAQSDSVNAEVDAVFTQNNLLTKKINSFCSRARTGMIAHTRNTNYSVGKAQIKQKATGLPEVYQGDYDYFNFLFDSLKFFEKSLTEQHDLLIKTDKKLENYKVGTKKQKDDLIKKFSDMIDNNEKNKRNLEEMEVNCKNLRKKAKQQLEKTKQLAEEEKAEKEKTEAEKNKK